MLQIDVNLLGGIGRAIREYPTLAADITRSFKPNQIRSKMEVVSRIPTGSSVCLLGGWYAIGLMLTNNDPSIKFTSVDKDPMCAKVGYTIDAPGYTHICADALRFNTDKFDVIVNSSTEHMDYDRLQFSFANIQPGKLCIFQNNNNTNVIDHINCFDTLELFVNYISEQFSIKESISTIMYNNIERYTIICTKT